MRTKDLTTVDLLLTEIDWLLICDPGMTVVKQGAVAVDGGTVVAAGSQRDLEARYRARETLPMSGHLVMPGLINTHVHAAMTLFRGIGDDLPLKTWLQEVIFPAEARHADDAFVELGTVLACAEMILGGTTTFCDGYFFEEAAARAAARAGIRAVLGQGVLDFPSPDLKDPSRARQRVEAFLDAARSWPPRLRPSLFCHAPYTCGPETLQWVKDLCRRQGLLFQIHVSETQWEVEEIETRYGRRPVFHLDHLGLLDPMTLCAHGVWLDPDEIALLAERGACLSHNVESNLKLASGVAPVPALIQVGVPVGLGTDGCASNNDLDLFSEMALTAKLHKATANDPTVCPARQVLRMATLDGARALGLSHAVGSLEPGKRADLIALRIDRPHLTPLYDPVSHIVYAARSSDVNHVWVDGRRVVQDGRLLTLDVPQLLCEAESVAVTVRSCGR
ncbi:5-methylthioadenosine/S-adenosylhomocysteine deaminase [Desulfacinum hydrothermale DSM 13146]|uniref:5-methylthioadenosine/S-adenosylhomocysteine deaminase n=1 Tax=Desulfacinum hydrothermale DSM 13146 TaxID=1121390 RepID=A0A1W1X485_9BACT|nr:amidohydrolase family protein [Desulfacinum hydrothermale]SMC18764.1 5-methylthioadenosine/S-adenosylhomocysteine deaminase [Desulfacinum hydrothermale DSM 13146]